MEKNGNKCERTCTTAEDVTVTSNRKIKCACDLVTRSPNFGECLYKIYEKNEWRAWTVLNANGKPVVDASMCHDIEPTVTAIPTEPQASEHPSTAAPETYSPTTKPSATEPSSTVTPATNPPTSDPSPTDPPVTQPAVLGTWSEWNACSAGCGIGIQSRLRPCTSGTCDATTSETRTCSGPDGRDCQPGCKLSVGDFEQDLLDTCSDMFRGPDGFYLPKSGTCRLSCSTTDDFNAQKWMCACTKKGVCQLKVDGTEVTSIAYFDGDEAEFDSATVCKGNLGGRTGDGSLKKYRWVDGRRSLAQPESDLTGESGWHLQDICYNRAVHRSFTAGDNLFDLPFVNREEWTASVTYGKVVERSDGVLVCRYSNPKYDWTEDHEMYFQLLMKPDELNWLSSELFWPYDSSYKTYSRLGQFNVLQLVTQGGDTIRHKRDGNHRALCRVEHNGEWHVGAISKYQMSNEIRYWDVILKYPEYAHYYGPRLVEPYCTAIASDGTVLTEKVHNKFFESEEYRGGPKTEYLVQLADDGSYWGKWSEFTDCPGFCGLNLRREKKRSCFNGKGKKIKHLKANNCYPSVKVRSDRLGFTEMTYDSVKKKCDKADLLSEKCPKWSRWAEWGECNISCGPGVKSRTRSCRCGSTIFDYYGDEENIHEICAEIDHPLAAEGLCGADNVESRACTKGACDTSVLATGDGVGFGCKSDTIFSNPTVWRSSGEHSLKPEGFTCYNTAGETHEELDFEQFENKYGFVRHNYACWSELSEWSYTCDSRFNMPWQAIIKQNPAICNCHAGVCEWIHVTRQDCTRGYEWIRMPIDDIASHPLASKIVDFNNPTSTDLAKVAITSSWNGNMDNRFGLPNRRIAAPVPITDNKLVNSNIGELDHHITYVLTHECVEGGLEWIEGPFDCPVDDTNNWPYSYIWHWKCKSEPRLYPTTESKDTYKSIYSGITYPVRVFGICRFKDENDNWIIGELIKHREKYTTVLSKFQCCPHGDSLGAGVTGCLFDSISIYETPMQPSGDYHSRPYQTLYSGNCISKGMTGWSSWSEWDDCSKTCENGAAKGTRSKTRTCENGDVGDFGCDDSVLIRLSEPCGMNLQCVTKGCTLDMNFVDFHRFRLSHTSGIQNSTYWQLAGVYTNRNSDLFAEPRDWSGFFPEGSMVASYRCFNPNDNKLSGVEHDATCICGDGDDCDWDREMPICTQHNTSHAGYTWLMKAKEDAYCVTANYGGVGVVINGLCHVTMGGGMHQQYFKMTQSLDGISESVIQASLDAKYASFDEAKDEVDYYALSSSCDDASAFKWVPVEKFDLATSVHLPTTFAWLQMNRDEPYRHQRAHLCRIEYPNGEMSYGRFVKDVCGNVVDTNSVTISVLALNTGDCVASTNVWSQCSGETGLECGPGTQTRDEELRWCRGTCMMDTLSRYDFHDPEVGDYQCNAPSYPLMKPEEREHHRDINDGSIMMARYPISSANFDFEIITLNCTGGGYWDIDYLTGDRYYALAPKESCKFGCHDPLYTVDVSPYPYGHISYGREHVDVAKCDRSGFLNGMLGSFQFLNEGDQQLLCEPDYCIFPSFGEWPVTDNEQQGTEVSMGVECDNQVENGNHVMVKRDSRCKVLCLAKNGVPYRVGTAFSKFSCERPIPGHFFDNQVAPWGACEGNHCLSDFLAKPFGLHSWPGEAKFAFDGQSYISDNDNMSSLRKMTSAVCYKTVDETCPSEVPPNDNEGDIVDGISWTCTNANEPGSKCTKVCGQGTLMLGAQKQTKTCSCTSSCEWKGQVSNCVLAECQLPENLDWPGVKTSNGHCKTSDGEVQSGPNYPEGTRCSVPCDKPGYKYDSCSCANPSPNMSTCVCNPAEGWCKFNARQLNPCIIAACLLNTDSIFWQFAQGFDYEGVHLDHFSEEVQCGDRFPLDHPDVYLAGLVPLGAKCYIKCKAGYEFKDAEVESTPWGNPSSPSFIRSVDGTYMYQIKCKETYNNTWKQTDYMWDVFDPVWGGSSFKLDKAKYPQCGPV